MVEAFSGGRYYKESGKHNRQFVGRVSLSGDELKKAFEQMGFTEKPLATRKSFRAVREQSWRRVEESSDMQLHAIVYDASGDYSYIYAHWEYRWDLSAWKHIRGHDFDADKGVKKMKELLNQNGINFEPIRP